MKNVLVFAVAAMLEIAGCFVFWVYGRTKIGQRGESNHAADVSANA